MGSLCHYGTDTLRSPVILKALWMLGLCELVPLPCKWRLRLCTFFYYPVPYPQVCEFSELQHFFHTVLLLMVYFLARKSFPGSCLSCRPSLLISFGLSLWLLAAGLHCSNIFISCTRLEQTNTLTTVFSNYINFIHWCLYFLPFQFRSVMWKLALFLCLLWCSESSLSSHMVLIAKEDFTGRFF